MTNGIHKIKGKLFYPLFFSYLFTKSNIVIPRKIYFFYSYFVLTFGLAISGYLLFHFFDIKSGQTTSDLCSVIFGKGCSNTAFSSLATILHIPLGGWGIIYFTFLGLLIVLEQWLYGYFSKELIKLAFWISVAGVLFSIYFAIYMILNPVFFCPFCAIFHVLNIILFFLIKKISNSTYSNLFHSLYVAFNYLILGKPFNKVFDKWKWLAFLIPFVIGLVLYQWVRIEGLSQTISKLSKYDPLEELISFDKQPEFEIIDSPETPVLGPDDAPVTLVVFSDFQCSNCGLFASNFHQLIANSEGRLNIKFKYFPLGTECNSLVKKEVHPFSCKAAYAAEAARRQGKFWEYHDSVFAINQSGFSDELFVEVAKSLHLDIEQFSRDFNSETCKMSIANNVAEGVKLELDGTPSVFLNGRRVYDLRPENLSFLVRYLSNNLNKNY
jgi:protein-disulfide isomerase/uncharacterized membrane protein